MTACSKYPKELNHYEKTLKAKYFRMLKNNVWEYKTQWNLLILAERHYRLKLLSSSFHSWLTYSRRKTSRKTYLERAINLYDTKLKSRIFSVLKENVECKWMLQKHIKRNMEINLMKKTWYYWREFVFKSLRARKIRSMILKIRALNSVRFAVEEWFHQWTIKLVTKVQYEKAIDYSHKLIKKKVIKSFKNYVKYRNERKELLINCQKQVLRGIKSRVLRTLKNYAQQKKLYRKHLQRITSFHSSYLIRVVLDKWSARHEHLLETRLRVKELLAVNHNQNVLLSKAFKNWKMWTYEQGIRNRATDKFADVARLIRINFYLRKWESSLHDSLVNKAKDAEAQLWRRKHLTIIYLQKMLSTLTEKRKENQKMLDCHFFYENNLKCRAFHYWKILIFRKREKNNEKLRAQYHYEVTIARKAIRKLWCHSIRQLKKKSAVTHYETRLVSQTFKKIRSFYASSIFYHSRIEDFTNKRRRQILSRTFHTFKVDWLNTKIEIQSALNFYNGRVLKNAFQTWQAYYQRRKKTKEIFNRNHTQMQKYIICNGISLWYDNMLYKRNLNEMLRLVRKNWDIALTKIYFKKWLYFIGKFRGLREKFLIFKELKSVIILRFYFWKIVILWEGTKIYKDNQRLALTFEKLTLTRKYFRSWITYTKWKKEKLRKCLSGSTKRLQYYSRKRDFQIPFATKAKRKQPIIPMYLRDELDWCTCEDGTNFEHFNSDDTYIISNADSGKLPVIL